MGLANTSVVLYQSIKIGMKWILCAVDEDSTHFPGGPFYVSWYEGKKKQMEADYTATWMTGRQSALDRIPRTCIVVSVPNSPNTRSPLQLLPTY